MIFFAHRPGGEGGYAKLPGKLCGGDGFLGLSQQVDGQKPLLQLGPGPLEDGACGKGSLMAAVDTLKQRPFLMRIGAVVAAARAAKTIRPAMRKQGLTAIFLRFVHLHKFHQCLGAVHGIPPVIAYKQKISAGSDGT